MSREYFKAYHSYLEAIEPLNDAERGRLFTALLKYSSTGEAPEFRGNERFVFPSLKGQIDRDIQAYADVCRTNTENGKKGGRPKKPNGFSETERNRTVFLKTEKSQGKDKGKEEGKDKGEDKEKYIDASAIAAASTRVCAHEQRSAAHEVFEELIKPLTDRDSEQLTELCQRYGENRVISAIRDASAKGGAVSHMCLRFCKTSSATLSGTRRRTTIAQNGRNLTMNKRICPLESQEQKVVFEVCETLKLRYPELELLYHVPNGGRRDAVTGAKLKAEGVKSGVPDLVLPVARAGYHGLYIELKRQHGAAL